MTENQGGDGRFAEESIRNHRLRWRSLLRTWPAWGCELWYLLRVTKRAAGISMESNSLRELLCLDAHYLLGRSPELWPQCNMTGVCRHSS